MYKKHFGFVEKPFGITPDPSFLYFSSKHKVAFSMLEYGFFEQDGITVITGDVGVGKTTLLQHLLSQVDDSRYSIGLINNTHRSLGTMLQWIALSLDIDTDGKDPLSQFRQIQQYLLDQYAQGRSTVLIVDEAQNLGKEALEELRLLTNINAHKDQLLKIILVGQPQLHELLQDPDLAQICQRISSEYFLGALDAAEVVEYVNHRLRHAGSTCQLFDDQALQAIHHFSFGVPRLINKLCDYALVLAFANGSLTIDTAIVHEVINANKLGGFRKRLRPTNAEMFKQSRDNPLLPILDEDHFYDPNEK